MATKAELLARINSLKAENARLQERLDEGINRLVAHHRREMAEYAQMHDVQGREASRLRQQRMIRVLEEGAELRPGEMLILQGPPTATFEHLVRAGEEFDLAIVTLGDNLFAARDGKGWSVAGPITTVLHAIAIREEHR